MRPHALVFILFTCLALISCSLFAPTSTAGDAAATQPATAAAQTSAIPSQPPTQASPTSLPSQTPAPDPTLEPPRPSPANDELPGLRQQINQVINSPDWVELGLSPERKAAWQDFAAGAGELDENELFWLKTFVQRWETLTTLVDKIIPWNAKMTLRALESPDAQGFPRPVLYAIDPGASQIAKTDQLFLVAHAKDGSAKALVLAPIIQGLSQRPSPDGEYVEYIETGSTGAWLLRADARPLDKKLPTQEVLIDMLEENEAGKDYQEAAIYPRFYFNLLGIESGFYLIEKLTVSQLKLLISVFQVFDQEQYAALKPFIFPSGEDVAFLISREDHPSAAALALPLGGTPRQGIVLLYSRNLFASKYETASGLAHEATHIAQGRSPGCDNPEGRLMREIGDGTIPDDFRDWSAEQIVQAARQVKVGAYHLSLWMSIRFGVDQLVRFYTGIIKTGTANGFPIINCE